MDNIANSEKEFAVNEFHAGDAYCTCSQRNKAADSAGFFVKEEDTTQWSKHEVYEVIDFASGKQF